MHIRSSLNVRGWPDAVSYCCPARRVDARSTDVGWKDAIDLRDNEMAEIIVRFTGFRGKYVFQCHNLEHEDMAMMGNLEIASTQGTRG